MLMIVPLMIWSARTLIDSQAWTAEMSNATPSAAARATRSAGVRPNNAVGVAANTGASPTPTTQPVNAAASIVPSMPMLTTPDRSHSTPHSAPSASGVADRMMIGAIGGLAAVMGPTSRQ